MKVIFFQCYCYNQVQLNFIVNALLYNTSGSYHRCSLDNGLCTLNPALSANIALLTTPGPRKVNFGYIG
jgi:hypothetical protein